MPSCLPMLPGNVGPPLPLMPRELTLVTGVLDLDVLNVDPFRFAAAKPAL